jgi:hypothetical protein
MVKMIIGVYDILWEERERRMRKELPSYIKSIHGGAAPLAAAIWHAR